MSNRAEQLARRFEHAHQEFAAVIESLTDDQWHTPCPDEQCTVAALAHHVAVAYPYELRAFAAIATGAPRDPVTWDALAQANAADAATHATCDRAETLQLLHHNAAQTTVTVRSFTDDQLARTGHFIAGLPALTVDQWLRRVLVGHITAHLASIRTTLHPETS
jgi:hypothetical protein